MFTVIIFILRHLADQKTTGSQAAKNLLNLWVEEMKSLEVERKTEAYIANPPQTVGEELIDGGVSIDSIIGSIRLQGVDDFLGSRWKRRVPVVGASGDSWSVQRSILSELVEVIDRDQLRQAVYLCSSFLAFGGPQIPDIHSKPIVKQLAKLDSCLDEPDASELAGLLTNELAAWSWASGERGMSVWPYSNLEVVDIRSG